MSQNPEDARDEALSGIDLHAWRVPPPAAVDRASLLVRALSPATAPAKRPRIAWILAAIVLVNVAIAALVIVLVFPPAHQTTVTVQPAGGGSIDAQVRDLLQRLEREQREIERRLAEIEELRALVVELSEKVRQYEQQDGKRDRTVPPKQRERQTPDRVERPPVEPPPADPDHIIAPPSSSCDEVSCVLSNYQGACCAKFRQPRPPKAATNGLPEGLDRQSISNGIATVKARVAACGDHSKVKGKVKVTVQVGANGLVTNVVVVATPEAALGACVAAAVQRAVFERTQNGGRFTYPFVF